MIPNTTPTPNILIDKYMKRLSDTALRIALIIIRKTYGWIADPLTGMRKEEDWIAYSQLMEFSGRERQAVSKALRELESFGLIDIRDQKGNQLKDIESRRGKKLMYRFSTSMIIKLVTPNQYDNRTSKIILTKETNTKELYKYNYGVSKRKPSCPLLNGSPLRERYPLGHKECVEYITSFKFVNVAKQFKFLHQLLRAGVDFSQIDGLIKKVQVNKFYQEKGWDMATIASEADRRSNAES